MNNRDVSFRIVENPVEDYDLDEIIRDYQNLELSVHDIRLKYGFTRSNWRSVLRCMQEQGVVLRSKDKGSKAQQKGRYYYRRPYGGFIVKRVINGIVYHFGTYWSEDEAKARVEELNGNGWDGLLEE